MAIYPAIFETNGQGGILVTFPDLPGCMTEGKNESEAAALAMDALGGHILALRDLGREVPSPSPLSALSVPEKAHVALVPGPEEDAPPVRINVSIKKSLLREVDAYAKREGMTRSGFLAAAARSLISELHSS